MATKTVQKITKVIKCKPACLSEKGRLAESYEDLRRDYDLWFPMDNGESYTGYRKHKIDYSNL